MCKVLILKASENWIDKQIIQREQEFGSKGIVISSCPFQTLYDFLVWNIPVLRTLEILKKREVPICKKVCRFLVDG